MSKTSRQAITTSVSAPIDFKVDPKTGVGYMSRRELARQLGVSHTAINKQVSALQPNAGAALDDFLVSKVSTHFLTKGVVRNVAFVEALMQAGARAFIYAQAGVQVHTTSNKLHEPCVPVRWLAQQLGRSRSSVDRTINVSIRRLKEYAVSQEVNYVNGERCVSPALVLCCMFTGKKMQAARGWLLTLAETDALPAPEVLLQLTCLIN